MFSRSIVSSTSAFVGVARRSVAFASAVLLSAALSTSATADTIRLASGEVIEGVNVQEETIKAVFYRKGGTARDVPSDQVLSIQYDEFPRLVQQAEDSVAEGAVDDGIADFDTYVDGQLANPTEKLAWAPAYAAYRSVELNRSLGRYPRVIEVSNRLLTSFKDSRFVPATYLAKAEAQRFTGDVNGAKATLEELAALVKSAELSQRYALDTEATLLEIDRNLSLADRQKRIAALMQAAGSNFPTVMRRAELLDGQAQIAAANAASEKKDAAGVDTALNAARARFEAILAAPESDDSVRAGAHVGLGDVYFFRAAPAEDVEGLLKAGHEYLKVTVLYPGERIHLVRALFFAGRSFHAIGKKTGNQVDIDRAQRIFYRLRSEFPGNPMAEESRNYRAA
jgi:hypothetical protein